MKETKDKIEKLPKRDLIRNYENLLHQIMEIRKKIRQYKEQLKEREALVDVFEEKLNN